MSPPPACGGYVSHTCDNHDEMLRIVVETRNDVKHIVRNFDSICEDTKLRRKEFEDIARVGFERLDKLEKTNDEKIGEARLTGKFSAVVAFLVSLIVSILAIAIPWVVAN